MEARDSVPDTQNRDNPTNDTTEYNDLAISIATLQSIIPDDYLALIEEFDAVKKAIKACPKIQETRRNRMYQHIYEAEREIYLTIGARAVGKLEALLGNATIDDDLAAQQRGEGGAS